MYLNSRVDRVLANDKTQENFLPKPLAERSRGPLGVELPPRFVGPRDRAQRTAPETTPLRIRLLLPRGPHALGVEQENAGRQNPLATSWSGDRARQTWRFAPPLRPSCVEKIPTADDLEGSSSSKFAKCEPSPGHAHHSYTLRTEKMQMNAWNPDRFESWRGTATICIARRS
jgi:hypothetical protein